MTMLWTYLLAVMVHGKNVVTFWHRFCHIVRDGKGVGLHCNVRQASCKNWERSDKTSEEYRRWKASHSCDINFEGSASAMEPQGTLQLFKSSLDYKI